MTNIATLLETAIAQALPDNWQQEPETHLPALSLIISNILLSALGGLMWYLQFFFYAWGHASIPAQYDYMSWMLHMSFYVLCGGLVGLVLKEWNNAGRRPVSVLSLGCVVIIIAANIVGLGMAS